MTFVFVINVLQLHLVEGYNRKNLSTTLLYYSIILIDSGLCLSITGHLKTLNISVEDICAPWLVL